MKNNKKGFTLLELMVTISIFSLLLGYFSLFFSNEIKLYSSKDNDIELRQDARIAIDRIVSKIRSKNGLTFVTRPDETISAIYEGSNIIINTTPNDFQGEINFAFDEAKGYGELKDKYGNKIVNNISNIVLTKEKIGSNYLINVEISCKHKKTDEEKDYSTAVRMYDY